MNVEKIADKLMPLMPQKISHLIKSRELADAELKSLIDKDIISTAYRTFGNDFYNKKILLSLPPEKIADGPINLGTVLYDTEKWPMGLTYGELLQNTSSSALSRATASNFSASSFNRYFAGSRTQFLMFMLCHTNSIK